MTITIQTDNFTSTEPQRVFIHQKLTKLEHFYNRITDIRVHLRVGQEDNSANKFMEVTVHVPGATLIASEHARSFEAATDMCLDKLRRQLIKYKEQAFSMS